MFYKKHGNQSEGNVFIPVTDKEIIDYCIANLKLSTSVWSQVQISNFDQWKKRGL